MVLTVDSPDLRHLCARADQAGLHHRPSDQQLARLDPEGYHVLEVFIGDRLPGQTADLPHRRTIVLLKMARSEKPELSLLDIREEDLAAMHVEFADTLEPVGGRPTATTTHGRSRTDAASCRPHVRAVARSARSGPAAVEAGPAGRTG